MFIHDLLHILLIYKIYPFSLKSFVTFIKIWYYLQNLIYLLYPIHCFYNPLHESELLLRSEV